MIWNIKSPTSEDYQGLGGHFVQEIPGFIWMPHEGLCWHCERPTTWMDLDFECWLHPGRCSEVKWDERAWAEVFARLREQGLWK